MQYLQLKKLQKEAGFSEIQKHIDRGTVWGMEGSAGRYAMQLIEAGACWLPLHGCRDYWGNWIPGRRQLKAGTKGTLQYSANYYNNTNVNEYE